MAVATKDARPREGTLAPRSGRLLQLALLLAPIVFLLVMAWRNRWVEEDAFLNFRVVDQIRAGHGPVFNVGERVEIFTSTLWLAMLTAARSASAVREDRVPVDRGRTAAHRARAVVGRARCRGVVALRLRAVADIVVSSPSALFVPFGVVVVAALPASWDWATSGLENGLSLAWLGALDARGGDRHPPAGASDVGPARARGWRAPRSGPARAARPRRRERRRDRRRALVAPAARCGARVAAGRVLRASGGLRDLPRRVLRRARSEHRARQGLGRHVLVAGLELSGRPRRALLAVGPVAGDRRRRRC